MNLVRATCTALVLQALTTSAAADPLPPPYVYLRDISSSIQQDMRYASDRNFLGRPVDGYAAAECILTRQTAEALSRVQTALSVKNLSLKVYDCYRPVRAVRAFEAWAENITDTKMRAEFYPDIDKRNLFSLGYISRNSTHSKGNTVDLTLVPLGSHVPIDAATTSQTCTLPAAQRRADNSLDFGTGYDCFSPLSHTANPAIADDARRNRELLVAHMRAAGFKNYAKEWWHFHLPGAGTDAQDFVVRSKAASPVPSPEPVLRK